MASAARNMTTAAEVVATASARGALPEVQALLVEPTWREVLAAEFDKPGAKQLQKFLHREWAEHKVFPPQAEIFRCLAGSSIGDGSHILLKICVACSCGLASRR